MNIVLYMACYNTVTNILKIYYLIRIKYDLCIELKDQSKNTTLIY